MKIHKIPHRRGHGDAICQEVAKVGWRGTFRWDLVTCKKCLKKRK